MLLINQFHQQFTLQEISKVTGPTDWVNSLVIIEKKDGSLRLCLDPGDLDTAIKREHYQVPTAQKITSDLAGAKYFSTLDAKDGFWQVELDKKLLICVLSIHHLGAINSCVCHLEFYLQLKFFRRK